MISIFTGIGIYLLLGLLALGVFDVATKRIRNKLTNASAETQTRLIAAGNPVNTQTASILLIGALWLFWPMVFIGILTDRRKDI